MALKKSWSGVLLKNKIRILPTIIFSFKVLVRYISVRCISVKMSGIGIER